MPEQRTLTRDEAVAEYVSMTDETLHSIGVILTNKFDTQLFGNTGIAIAEILRRWKPEWENRK
jgi:hypothetical protein